MKTGVEDLFPQRLFFGAGMGTRTPTPEAREPKSRMSTNSIMPADSEYKTAGNPAVYKVSIFTRRDSRGGAYRLIHISESYHI